MAAPEKTLRGDLGVFGLFDLGQLFSLNRSSGCLTLKQRDRKGYLYFRDGQVVHALDGAQSSGEEAAYRLFTWESGTFEFRPEDWHGAATIERRTDSLMLDAARRMDEAKTTEKDPVEQRSEERLRDRQQGFGALRDAFGRIVREVGKLGGNGGDSAPALELIASLSRSGDRIVYRPGHPPRVRRGAKWSDLGTAPMTANAYEALRVRLFEASSPPTQPLGGAGSLRRMTLSNGRSIALALVGEGTDESLWLRPVDLPPPPPSLLVGDVTRLDELAAHRQSLVLVGGPTLDATRDLLHAFVGLLAGDIGGTIALVSEDETYRHVDSPSVVVRVPPALLASAWTTLEPGVVVLDPANAPGEPGFAELQQAARLVGAVAADAATMLQAWLARVAPNVETGRTIFEGRSIGLVVAVPEAGEVMTFDAWALTPEQCASAMSGDFRALASALSERPARQTPKRRAA